MAKKKTLRERLEHVWSKREPAGDSELTAEGKKARTPTEGEFFGNLEKALHEPGDELLHSRKDQNGS